MFPSCKTNQLKLIKEQPCIHPPFLSQGGCNSRLIFKSSITGLNSDFSFSKTGCHSKAKKTYLTQLFTNC